MSFKENTDDIRESVSIKLIKKLLKRNCRVLVHDPKVTKKDMNFFRHEIKYCDRLQQIFENSHCVVILTPWPEYKKLNKNLFLKMSNRLVIDTRRILKLKDDAISYIGLGIGVK